MSVEIRPVASRRELKTFIKLPWRLYRNEPLWVPPLIADQRKILDRARNPFFKHAEAEYFLAYRDGRPVGRISAQVDRNFNEFQDNTWGLFGFFECEDDPEAAAALFEAAERWLRERGRDRMVGPMDFTTNDELGVVVEGFDESPAILMKYTPRFYPRLFEAAGFEKAMDLLLWKLRIEGRDKVHPAIWRMAADVEDKHGITVRPFRKKDIENEIDKFLEIYNGAWERNWGFVPLTEDEVRHYAKDLKPILSEDWAFIAEKDGEVVGAALTLPDFNQVLRHLNGRLLPIGWIKALWYRRKIDRVRVFALGVKKEYQHTGVAAKFYECHFDSAERTPQRYGYQGWILETNKPMNRAMEGMGGEIVTRHRLFEREIEPEAGPDPAEALVAAGVPG